VLLILMVFSFILIDVEKLKVLEDANVRSCVEFRGAKPKITPL